MFCYSKSRHDLVDVHWGTSNETLKNKMDLNHDYLVYMYLFLLKRNSPKNLFNCFKNMYLFWKKNTHDGLNSRYIVWHFCKFDNNDNYCFQHQHSYYQRFIYFIHKNHLFDIDIFIYGLIHLNKLDQLITQLLRIKNSWQMTK